MKATVILTTIAAIAAVFGMVMMNTSEKPAEILTMSSSSSELTQMYNAEECTDERAEICAIFIASVIDSCVTAMEAAGVDILADIRCARARKLITTKKDCIPCLCQEVKKRGWNWVECPSA